MDNLPHYIYHEEVVNGEKVFGGRGPCYCNIGKNHWAVQEPQDKEKVDDRSDTRLLDKDGSSRAGEADRAS
jgi:hypothetical protein